MATKTKKAKITKKAAKKKAKKAKITKKAAKKKAKRAKMILHTDGKGLWSDEARKVFVTGLRVYGYGQETMHGFGGLRVYFNPSKCNIHEHRLIYTDDRFIEELRDRLHARGLPYHDVNYSEQGMQGDDYVSCAVGEDFMKAWGKRKGI